MKNYMSIWTVRSNYIVHFARMMDYLRCWESRKTIEILKSDRKTKTAEFGIISNDPDRVDEMLGGLSQYLIPYNTETVKIINL